MRDRLTQLLLLLLVSTLLWGLPVYAQQASSSPQGKVVLLLRRTKAQRASLQKLLQDLHDPRSASYHKWLKPEDVAAQFGAPKAQIAKLNAALANHGLEIKKVLNNGMTVEVTGTNQALKQAFTIVRMLSNGSRKTVPALPTDVAVFAEAVSMGNKQQQRAASKVSFDRLKRTYQHLAASSALGTAEPGAHPLATLTGSGTAFYALTPGDIAVQYGLPSYVQGSSTQINGYGSTVGVISDYNVNISYLNSYGNTFGFYMPSIQVIVDGSDPGTSPNSIPTYMEIEAIAAVAPNTSINVYTAADDIYNANDIGNQPGIDLSLVRAVTDNAVNVLLYPFQGCEAFLDPTSIVDGYEESSEETFLDALFEAASAQGITVITPAGDVGSAACDNEYSDAATQGLAVNGVASTPYSTAVGGTDFYYGEQGAATSSTYAQYWSNSPTAYTTLTNPVPEQAWNDSNLATNQNASSSYLLAGGGGVSTLGLTNDANTTEGPYPQPWWQLGVVPSSITTTARTIPDISFFAGDFANNSAYVFCADGTDCDTDSNPNASNTVFTEGSGTEVSAALFAGMMALVVGEHGAQGNVNLTLYSMSKTTQGVFNDVIYGTNSVACTAGTPNCTNGYLVDQHGNPAYPALPGYDAATGLGSLNATALVLQWSPPNTSPTSTTLAVLSPSTNQPLNTFQHGTPVNITTTVTGSGGTPTGDVALITDAAQDASQGLGTITLAGGAGSITNDILLPGGTYHLYARYGGDAVYQSSLSAGITLNISPVPCTMVVFNQSIQSGGTVSYGTPVSITMEPFNANNLGDVTNATGYLTVQDNGTTIGTVSLNSDGDGVFTNSTLLPGSHQLTFTYSGDPSFQTCSLSSGLSFTVTAAPTTTTVTSSISTVSSSNGNYTLAAVITPTAATNLGALPKGTVTFKRGTTTLASGVALQGFYSGPLSNIPTGEAVAYLGGGGLAAGSNSITATFVPATSTGYSASTSSAITVNLGGASGLAASNLTISTADGGNTYFDTMSSVTVNANVTGNGTPTGSVALYVNGTFAANMTSLGNAQWTYVFDSSTTPNLLLPLPIGHATIVGQYSGDAANASDWSNIELTILDDAIRADYAMTTPVDYKILATGTTHTTFPITLTSLKGFTGTIYFGLPDTYGNINCTFPSPGSVNLTASKTSSTVTLTCTNIPTTPGRYYVNVFSNSGVYSTTPNLNSSLAHQLPIAIVVQTPAPAVPLIHTIAGNGTSGTTGDNGLAINAELVRPYQALPDGLGRIYISDLGNCRLRSLTISTGNISTIAGDGTCNSSGDGGPAINAEVQNPGGLAVDTAGDLYFAELATPGTVREINDSSGGISSVVPSSAGYGLPDGVAVDSSGNLYFSVQTFNAVYQISQSTGQLTTYAGPFSSPQGIALDASGNLYVADEANSVIRKVNTSTGAITIVAGNGTEGFAGDGGLATDAELDRAMGVAVDAGGNLYISDSNNNRIRKVDATTQYISTIAGNGTAGFTGDGIPASEAELNTPEQLSFDSSGTLYIADQGNHRIRTITGLSTQ